MIKGSSSGLLPRHAECINQNNKYLVQISESVLKMDLFGSFMMQFLLIICVCTHISLKNKYNLYTLHAF